MLDELYGEYLIINIFFFSNGLISLFDSLKKNDPPGGSFFLSESKSDIRPFKKKVNVQMLDELYGEYLIINIFFFKSPHITLRFTQKKWSTFTLYEYEQRLLTFCLSNKYNKYMIHIRQVIYNIIGYIIYKRQNGRRNAKWPISRKVIIWS